MTGAITKNPIPFLDLKRQYAQIRDEIHSAIESVMEDAAFSGGPFVERFEQAFADYLGVKHVVAINSGTSALHLAMLALGVKNGDEVIMPASTFIATAWGATHAGATPVFVDCDVRTWNIDPEKIEQKISSRTKAIIGVHLYGQPCDISSILSISKKYGIPFVEDAAQAHGAMYEGKCAGTFGEMACFSFYPGKNLGAYGEGGAVATNNKSFAERIKILRNQGSSVKYYHDEIGFNERMHGMQAAILSVKLKYLDRWNARRRQIAKMYQHRISSPAVKIQQAQSNAESAFHLFVITVDDREAMLKHLNGQNIFPGMHYPLPVHLQKAYSHLGYKKGDIPNAEYLSDHCLSLPMFPELTDEEAEYVITAVNGFRD